MNAIATSGKSYGFGRKLLWLIRREWWEHRGSFFTGPLIAACISLFLFTLMLGISQVLVWKLAKQASGHINFGSMSYEEFMRGADIAENFGEYAALVNFMTLGAASWPMIIFGLAVFFYLLSSLYDERRDRSILLWKSLPLSDTQTVLSKYLTAMLVAPLSAALISLAAMLALGLIISVFILINGGNPLLIYWQHLSPGLLLGAVFGWMPIYVLWALPTVGWLMLCSAWARNVPFLWAILLPLLAGIAVSMFSMLGYSSGGFWYHIVWRLLASAWPGGHMLHYLRTQDGLDLLRPLQDDLSLLLRIDGPWGGWHLLASPELWLGAIAGIAMILIAIRLRRWRSEA